jgi:hypothetical protein
MPRGVQALGRASSHAHKGSDGMADNSQMGTGQGLPGWPERWTSGSTNILIAAESFGEPKIQHLHPAFRCDLDVGRLEIAMNDSVLVRVLRASAICLAIGSASCSGMGPEEMRSASVAPSTSSITSARSSTP